MNQVEFCSETDLELHMCSAFCTLGRHVVAAARARKEHSESFHVSPRPCRQLKPCMWSSTDTDPPSECSYRVPSTKYSSHTRSAHICGRDDGHLHAVRDEESGVMEAAAGLDDGPCMPGLGSVALGGAGGRRWSWWHHPACRRRALGFLADDLFSALRYPQIVATTGSRARRTPQTPVCASRTCPV